MTSQRAKDSYYYANEDNLPVGPCTTEQMRLLLLQGTLHENSWVIAEGATEWKSYASCFPPSAPEPPITARTRHCANCGKANETRSNFCAGCGANLTNPLLSAAKDSPYRGYGGWLSFFCIIQIVVAPLAVMAITLLPLMDTDVQELLSQYPRVAFMSRMEDILNWGMAGFGIYVGIILRRLRPGAPRIAKRYLLTGLAFAFSRLFFPYLCGDIPSQISEAMMAEGAKIFIRTLIVFAIWYSYFNVSKRIKATFPADPNSSRIDAPGTIPQTHSQSIPATPGLCCPKCFKQDIQQPYGWGAAAISICAMIGIGIIGETLVRQWFVIGLASLLALVAFFWTLISAMFGKNLCKSCKFRWKRTPAPCPNCASTNIQRPYGWGAFVVSIVALVLLTLFTSFLMLSSDSMMGHGVAILCAILGVIWTFLSALFGKNRCRKCEAKWKPRWQ